ncbi:MAG TPA: I78 family peptidase inhibitor [Vitreimonas sp.]|uniref:I78 family peptidase inhibitor n=1 Tax=Vitreimonas sp. TaxID=3069702 RepID=UPI002D3E5518|nr:I78 family peptidase inhibitor [Vitreimonas sp.]HYD85950.1 I78 family peptidase inhibitor [Vitreimonas sp.]
MLRSSIVAVALALSATGAAAEERTEEPAPQPPVRDRFVVSDDTCGASRYAHLLGEEFAELHQASLVPANANVVDRGRLTTLEYEPHRLNVVVNGAGRIIAVGCF